MPGLVVLVTSPRLPAGLLSAVAWRAIDRADEVLTADLAAPLPTALRAADVEIEKMEDVSAEALLARAADRSVVWLAGDDGDGDLVEALAAAVVRRAESGSVSGSGSDPFELTAGASPPEVEVLVGSFDPPGARLLDAVTVMDTLRRECPWDRQQTHESLVRYLLEETYEVVEAIETGQRDHLREELGDLLFQVLFHARVAEENDAEAFTVDDVAAGLVEKLVRRHPHVFADTEVADADEVEANWESIKAAEKSRTSVLDGIPPALPALSLAAAVVRRALRAKTALSVPTPEGEATSSYTEETLGEVLFALAAAAQAAGLDPERALRSRVRQEMSALRTDPSR